MLLRLILLIQIFYIVNQIHFPVETGIPASPAERAVPACRCSSCWCRRRCRPHDRITRRSWQPSIVFFFAMLVLAFISAEMRAPQDILADLTYLKNALFYPLFYFLYLRCKQDEKTHALR